MASQATSKATSKPSEAPRSFPSLLSVAVALAAVIAAAWTVVDPSQLQARVQLLVDNYVGVSLGATVPGDTLVDCLRAQRYLTDELSVKGFHVLCIKKVQEEEGESLATLDVVAFKDGIAPAMTTQSSVELDDLKVKLETLLDIHAPTDDVAVKYKQPYAFFTPDGERLERLQEMVNRVVFLFEGGQFIWPGIRVGHKTVVKNVAGKGDVVLETLSMVPLVFSVEEFLKDDEIDVIMNLSVEQLKPSTVTLMDGHENRAATDWRTSTTYFLPSDAHPKIEEIDQRVADLTKVPIDHQEDVQVLRYEETQKYDHHTDYFPVEHHKNSPHVLESIDYGYKNRMITVFWYISDVAKGGHTIFPRAGGAPRPVSMKDCTKGLKVPPKKRKVIVFYSMLPNGEGDPMSLHGGCPVEEGVKYSGNKWLALSIFLVNDQASLKMKLYFPALASSVFVTLYGGVNAVPSVSGVNYDARNGSDWETNNSNCKSFNDVYHDMLTLHTSTDKIRVNPLVQCDVANLVLQFAASIGVKVDLGITTAKGRD
ncbi:Prolyl 4-hydroxylase subunit alpha-1 [Phytophthora cinnamomi]|uniref:Prolyl 4-hydroxylase subunit alpha-1 n=1 Tax=Phytophthora cinnamomi TaxID=4785 RepID=UPI00355A806F|nr:Prolyl 4-hydroxylase subunit alpha-1 [Phytophthora cinnamomi]